MTGAALGPLLMGLMKDATGISMPGSLWWPDSWYWGGHYRCDPNGKKHGTTRVLSTVSS
jgi:hypothetical protein